MKTISAFHFHPPFGHLWIQYTLSPCSHHCVCTVHAGFTVNMVVCISSPLPNLLFDHEYLFLFVLFSPSPFSFWYCVCTPCSHCYALFCILNLLRSNQSLSDNMFFPPLQLHFGSSCTFPVRSVIGNLAYAVAWEDTSKESQETRTWIIFGLVISVYWEKAGN